MGLTVVLGAIGLICLPENVAVQWSGAGEVRHSVSKYLASLIGLCCGAFGAWYWRSKDRSSLVGAAKYLWSIFDFLVGCIGIIVLLAFLMMNR